MTNIVKGRTVVTMGSFAYCCPNCGAVIYDRTKGSCGVCGNELPQGSFLTPTDGDTLRRQGAEDQAGHKRDKEAQELEEQRRQDSEH